MKSVALTLSGLTMLAAFLCPLHVSGQKKQLTPSGKVEKIAFIDHIRLRKEYHAFATAKKQLATEGETENKSLTKELSQIDFQAKDQLKRDSLHGSKKQQQIIDNTSLKKTELYNQFQSSQHLRTQKRLALMKEYETKITTAISAVVAEGGYTDVKPLDKNTTNERGTNITDLVLKKLN